MTTVVQFLFSVVFAMFTWQILVIANNSGRIADRLGEIEQHLREIALQKSLR